MVSYDAPWVLKVVCVTVGNHILFYCSEAQREIPAWTFKQYPNKEEGVYRRVLDDGPGRGRSSDCQLACRKSNVVI